MNYIAHVHRKKKAVADRNETTSLWAPRECFAKPGF